MTLADRLAEIQARADNATDGPWTMREVDDEWTATVSVEAGTRLAPGGRGVWTSTDMIVEHELVDDPDDDTQPNDDQRRADAEFIAHARTDVPALIAALRAALDAGGTTVHQAVAGTITH